MKKILSILLAACTLLAACQKEGPRELKLIGAADDGKQTVEKSALVSGSNVSVRLEATFDYDVIIAPDAAKWVSVSSASRTDLTLKVERNEGEVERTAGVELCNGDDVLATVIISQDAPAPMLKYPAGENNEFRRVVFFPSYRTLTASAIPDEYLEMCNVAVYAFIEMDSNLKLTLKQPDKLISLASRCHAKGIKVLLSFSGSSKYYKEMVSKASTRKNFVDKVIGIVDKYGLDGVDNDWEYPSASDASKTGNLYLMRMLSNELHCPSRGKLLTMDITDGRWTGGVREGIDPQVYDCCDWFNNMSYNSVLASDKPEGYNALKIMDTSYNWWVVTRKMPARKFVLGLPLYGTDPYTDTSWGYATILNAGGDPDKDVAVVKSSDGTPHTFFYNGRPTVRTKVSTMKERGCGGYMFWEGSFDSFDEYSLLRTAMEASE